MEIEEIRNELLEIKNLVSLLHNRQKKLCGKVHDKLKVSSDISEKKEMIDFVFANEVEELMEFHFRKIFLPKEEK